ncbi:MAG: sulfite exporter TauE/SafE family protein [Flavobacteriales bacterium]|nr:sulfite exporter TauE/SafE family protein [Flavobacteriales bacterium]
MQIVLFAALLLVAEVIGTIGGFGSSMLVMPIATAFMPFEKALGLTAIFHVLSNAAKMVLFREGFSRRLILWMGVPAVIGVVIGARAASYLSHDLLRVMLGILLVVMALFLLLAPWWRLRADRRAAIWGGAISGSVAGVVGTGGAIRGLVLSAFGLEKSMFIATSAWIDMGVDLSRSVVYFLQGFVEERTWTYLPLLAMIGFTGTWMGKRILVHVPQERFRGLVLGLVLVVGAYLLAQPFL